MTDDNPWIEWNGGECPVAAHIHVDAKVDDGTDAPITDEPAIGFILKAENWTWEQLPAGRGWRIIAYRVVSKP